MTVRIRNVTTTSFEVKLQEEGIYEGFEVRRIDFVTDAWQYEVNYNGWDKNKVAVIGSIQTCNNDDTANVRIVKDPRSYCQNFWLKIEEEKSLDLETTHPYETVDVFIYNY